MMIQLLSNSQIEKRADSIGLNETDHTFDEQEFIEEDPAQVYCPSQEHIRLMCRMIRSDWSEKDYQKRSAYKPARWLVSVVSIHPDTMESSDE
ncbi:MAG TPA: hypothetical protein VMM56_03735 [Planctomycetaceae bacterium]|nr:hypothetical protein [Planctomycetaceae bacterium]